MLASTNSSIMHGPKKPLKLGHQVALGNEASLSFSWTAWAVEAITSASPAHPTDNSYHSNYLLGRSHFIISLIFPCSSQGLPSILPCIASCNITAQLEQSLFSILFSYSLRCKTPRVMRRHLFIFGNASFIIHPDNAIPISLYRYGPVGTFDYYL